MLNYFSTLTENEIREFINTIPCEELSNPFSYTIFYDLKNIVYKKDGLRKKIMIIEISPEILIEKEDGIPFSENINIEDVRHNKLKLLIDNMGIFNYKKNFFFKRKRREDIEELFIRFLTKKEKEKREKEASLYVRKFSFGNIRNNR